VSTDKRREIFKSQDLFVAVISELALGYASDDLEAASLRALICE
jgi:hypothetical protein